MPKDAPRVIIGEEEEKRATIPPGQLRSDTLRNPIISYLSGPSVSTQLVQSCGRSQGINRTVPLALKFLRLSVERVGGGVAGSPPGPRSLTLNLGPPIYACTLPYAPPPPLTLSNPPGRSSSSGYHSFYQTNNTAAHLSLTPTPLQVHTYSHHMTTPKSTHKSFPLHPPLPQFQISYLNFTFTRQFIHSHNEFNFSTITYSHTTPSLSPPSVRTNYPPPPLNYLPIYQPTKMKKKQRKHKHPPSLDLIQQNSTTQANPASQSPNLSPVASWPVNRKREDAYK